jgi:hypothetical protein
MEDREKKDAEVQIEVPAEKTRFRVKTELRDKFSQKVKTIANF